MIMLMSSISIGHAQNMYGVSGNNLIKFNASTATSVQQTMAITGMGSGQLVSGLDFRPNTGELYTMGYATTTGQARLYKLNTTTGAATAVGNSNVTLATNMGHVGMDFDPTSDQMRITGSNGSSYRLHPSTGAIVGTDANMAYGNSDANFGTTARIGSLAYSNNFIGSSNSKLYGYDNVLNVMTSLNASSGSLTTIGASGIALNVGNQSSDMDIYYDAATQTDRAYFVGRSGTSNNTRLYSMNLTTGHGTLIGAIGAGAGMPVSYIASSINAPYTGGVTGEMIWGITMNGNLVSFDTDQPGQIRSTKAVTGVTSGQNLMGMDYRPSTGVLYAMGYNSATGAAQLYTLDVNTGVATTVGASINLGIGLGSMGFDFNPLVDRIRVTGSNGSNFRIDPTNGTIAATDTNFSYAAGDVNQNGTATLGAVAYSNSYTGATTTTMYGFDQVLNIMTSLSAPNNGSMNTIGASGITSDISDRSFDMDIYYNAANQTNTAYFIGNNMGQASDRLYKVNLTTGNMTLVGSVGLGVSLRSFAVAATQATTGVDLELSITSTSMSYTQYVNVPYTITVRNNGTQTAHNVVVSAGLPNGMVHTSNTANHGSYNLYNQTWKVGTLTAGQSAVLTLTLFPLVTGNNIDAFVQVMSMDGNDADSTPGNDTDQTVNEDDEASLTLSSTGLITVDGGGTTIGNSNLSLFAHADQSTYNTYRNVNYHVLVVNNGPDAATGINVQAGLPQNFVHTSNNTTNGQYSLYNQQWKIANLGVGDSAWLHLTLFPLSNTASVNNFFQIMNSNQTDANSTPGNGTCCTALEDDEANVNVAWSNNFGGADVPQFMLAGLTSGQVPAMVYPSPATSAITVGFVGREDMPNTTVTIFDHIGRVIEVQQTNLLQGYNEWTFDISQFNNGVYFVRLPGETLPLKFIKS